MRKLLAAFVGLVVLVSGCGKPDARAVTAKEADRLAVSRFLNYQAGGRTVQISVPGTPKQTVVASVDFTKHVGYGVMWTKGSKASGSQGLLQWSGKALALRSELELPKRQPTVPPAGGWQGRQLQQKGSSLDTALLLTFNLASDRPDNAQLLKQNGAKWVGDSEVGGTKTDVFEGPREKGAKSTRLKYYLDSTGKMAKVEARLGTAQQPVVITFDKGKYIPVRTVPGLPT